MRTLIRTAAVIVAVGLAAGCATIPESSRVEIIGPRVSETSESPVAPPPDDLDPLTVVRRFIEASAKYANGYAAAKAYLTEAAAENWNDSAPVIVLDDTFNTVYAPGSGNAKIQDTQQVLLRGQQLGELGADAAFVANRAPVTPTMELVHRDGKWRIDRPPDVLYIRLSDFNASYHPVNVMFVDPGKGTLVTDRRWVFSEPPSSWPGRAIDLLLGGPSGALKDAVVNHLDGAKVHTNVLVGENDVVTVDLTGLPPLSDSQRRLAAAQIVGTLKELVSLRIRIRVDGAPLVPNKSEWAGTDVKQYEPDQTVKPDLPALAVSGRRLVRQEGGGVDGPAGDGSLPVESAAQSSDGTLISLVTNDGSGPRLWLGPVAGPQPVGFRAASMTRPTWRLGAAPEVWTVINGEDGAGAVLTETGSVVSFGVDLNDLAVKGKITDLRLSRDGVRVAAVVDGALYVAVVVGSGTETKVRNPRLLIGPGAAQVADVDWKGTDKVVVGTRSKDNPQVYEVTVDGLAWTRYENINLTGPLTGIASAAGRPVLVADQGGLWSALDSRSLWHSEGFGPGVDPLYPG